MAPPIPRLSRLTGGTSVGLPVRAALLVKPDKVMLPEVSPVVARAPPWPCPPAGDPAAFESNDDPVMARDAMGPVTDTAPPLAVVPVPAVAAFWLNVVLLIVRFPEADVATKSTAPPAPLVAVLDTKVEPEMARLPPNMSTAPPNVAVLFVRTQFVKVATSPVDPVCSAPPPNPPAWPPEMVRAWKLV